MFMYAAMAEDGFSLLPQKVAERRVEAKEPVKSHGGAGRNIHKGRRKGKRIKK